MDSNPHTAHRRSSVFRTDALPFRLPFHFGDNPCARSLCYTRMEPRSENTSVKPRSARRIGPRRVSNPGIPVYEAGARPSCIAGVVRAEGFEPPMRLCALGLRPSAHSYKASLAWLSALESNQAQRG